MGRKWINKNNNMPNIQTFVKLKCSKEKGVVEISRARREWIGVPFLLLCNNLADDVTHSVGWSQLTVQHKRRRSFSVTCPGLHHLLLTSTVTPLSLRCWVSVCPYSLKELFLQPCCVLIRAPSSSVLSASDLTRTTMIKWRNCLYLLFLFLCLVLLCILDVASSTHLDFIPGINWAFENSISCSHMQKTFPLLWLCIITDVEIVNIA